jgi:hypothetical protein
MKRDYNPNDVFLQLTYRRPSQSAILEAKSSPIAFDVTKRDVEIRSCCTELDLP